MGSWSRRIPLRVNRSNHQESHESPLAARQAKPTRSLYHQVRTTAKSTKWLHPPYARECA